MSQSVRGLSQLFTHYAHTCTTDRNTTPSSSFTESHFSQWHQYKVADVNAYKDNGGGLKPIKHEQWLEYFVMFDRNELK